MLLSDIAFLRCVDCWGSLSTVEASVSEDVLTDGIVVCDSCGRSYPILNTVGVFFRFEVLLDFLDPTEVEVLIERGWTSCLAGGKGRGRNDRQLAVMNNWAYQWGTLADSWKAADFEGGGINGADAFWSFIRIPKEQIAGAKVLVTAGGLGREAYHLVKAGPSKLLVNEIGVEIYKLVNLIPDSGRRLVLLHSDMTALPLFPNSVDVAICDHALQHVPDHKAAFKSLVLRHINYDI